MALFKPYKITSDKLADLPVREGQIVITTDTKKLYVDISATERIEVTSDAEVDLTDYVTTTMLTSALGEEASEREKQDGLLEDLINTKLDTSSADNRYALKNNPELTGDVSITNAGWALGKITAAHPNNDDTNLTYYKYVIGFDSLHRPYFAKYEGETKVSTIYLSSDSVILDQPINFTDASGVGSNSSAANQTRINIGAAAENHTHDLASSFVDGFMSSEDKVKLNNLDSTISAAVSAEATERQQQDTALENAIDEKIGQDNILAGDNINLLKDGINNVTISADSYYAGNGIEENEHTFSLKIQDTNLNAYVGQETEGFILMPHSTTEDGLYGHSIPYDSEIFTGGSSNCFTIKDGGITAEKIADGVIPEVKDVTLASLGVTATAEELNYMDGVTSSVQNQLNNKAAASHTHDDRYYTETEVDNLLANKSNTGHTHTAANITDLDDAIAEQIPDIPTELPNPEALTISLNGTSQGAYNGSAAKSINITAASVGAAASTHNHAASAITSGTFALDRIPIITDGKIQSVSASKITGTIPSSVLPSYVDDVLEYNGTSNFPDTGETGKIYVDTSTNKTYRWGGSDYVEISASLALGTTSSTAFRGDYGNTAYTHATAKGSAFSSGLYKITTNSQGHVTAATAVTKADITGLGIPAQDTNTNTTYTLTKSGSTITLTGSDGSKTSVTDANTTYSLSSFGITATAAELNKLDGCTATVTELNYVDGVTSNIQTQLNNKAAASHNHSAANITSGTLAVTRGGTGTTALTGASGLIHNMFDTSGVTSYIASFTSNWADGGYCTPQQLRSAQGLGNTLGALPVANGGTGSTTASAARSALGITPANIGALPLAGGTMNVNAQIARTGSSTSWVTGRSAALLKTTSSGSSFYGPIWSCKSYQGSWDCGTYTSNTLHFSYITDTDFSKNNNKQTADIIFNTNGSITAKTFVGALSGNASTATTATQANYWTTARTLTFTGNVTGSVSVRGNANMSCALTLANDSVTSAKIAANAVTASEIASGAVGLSELSSAVGTVAVQSATPTDSHVKLWIKV